MRAVTRFPVFSNIAEEHADKAKRFLLHFAARNPTWKLRPAKRFVLQRFHPFNNPLARSPIDTPSRSPRFPSAVGSTLVLGEQIFHAASRCPVFEGEIIVIAGLDRVENRDYPFGDTVRLLNASDLPNKIKSL